MKRVGTKQEVMDRTGHYHKQDFSAFKTDGKLQHAVWKTTQYEMTARIKSAGKGYVDCRQPVDDQINTHTWKCYLPSEH